MTWEVKEGHCANCGQYGSWLEFVDARQLPPNWFEIPLDTKARVVLCSVKCVGAWSTRAQAQESRPPVCPQPRE